MKIDRIEYQKNYNIMGMQWEKIIAGGTLEDGDNFQDCVKQLRNECDQAAQSKINALYQDQDIVDKFRSLAVTNPIISYNREDPQFENQPEEKISPAEQIENLITEIENATSENILTFKLAAAQNVRTMGAFQKRLKQLNIPN